MTDQETFRVLFAATYPRLSADYPVIHAAQTGCGEWLVIHESIAVGGYRLAAWSHDATSNTNPIITDTLEEAMAAFMQRLVSMGVAK